MVILTAYSHVVKYKLQGDDVAIYRKLRHVLFAALIAGPGHWFPNIAAGAEREILAWAGSRGQCLTLPYCSDAQRNDAGELINMDYFAADQDPETKHLLHLVEMAHTNKVVPQIGSNDYNGALSDIKYTLNRFPNHPRGLLLMALYGKLTKKPGLVIPYYEKALRLFPQHAMTYAQYGAYMVTLDHVDDGIRKLERAAEMNPDLVIAYVWLAGAYDKKGNAELARQAESKARNLGFKGPIAIDSLQNVQRAK